MGTIIWRKIASFFGSLFGSRSICLIGEKQSDGYTFVHSPDLPGFSLVLAPGEDKDTKSIVDAVYPPLMAFLEAQFALANTPKREPTEFAVCPGQSRLARLAFA